MNKETEKVIELQAKVDRLANTLKELDKRNQELYEENMRLERLVVRLEETLRERLY